MDTSLRSLELSLKVLKKRRLYIDAYLKIQLKGMIKETTYINSKHDGYHYRYTYKDSRSRLNRNQNDGET